MSNILIFGATSGIAREIGRLYAERGDALYLFARGGDELDAIASDFRIRGAESVMVAVLDVLEMGAHKAALDIAVDNIGNIDVAIVAHGTLPDQRQCERDFDLAEREIRINAVGTVSLLSHLANLMEAHKSGTIAVITSVAGERGRQSNYVYGSAKAMVSVFCQGLRNRLFKSGVYVVELRPGFVDTPMTAAFDKGALWASPRRVARDIVRAVDSRKCIVYTPWFWRIIMWVICRIPESIFRRLTL